MKKLNLILAFLLIFSLTSLHAQYGKRLNEDTEEYYSQKIAFITQALELSPDEATVFWPLYNEHAAKKKVLLSKMKEHRNGWGKRLDEITEAEAMEAIDFFHQHMTDMHDLTIGYQHKYLKVISAKKVLLLQRAEKDFRRKMLRKLGQRKRKNRATN